VALGLTGKIVPFDGDDILEDGAVYVDDSGRIAAVLKGTEPAPPNFPASARRVDTGGVIYPGLIDLHSHVAYNTLPLWEAEVPFAHHDIWPNEDGYGMSVTWPARVLQTAAAEALIKYVEVKAIVGGTTAIQGAPRTTRPVKGWLVRLVDVERFEARKDVIRAATIQKRKEHLPAEAVKMRDEGCVLIYHVAEGKAGENIPLREYNDLADTGCLQSRLVSVHATALKAADFERWRKAIAAAEPGQQGTIAWSPFSNLWLYGETTDVRAARRKKLRIALGSDWAPSGTKHVLGELKLADILNKRRFGGQEFTDRELCELVTVNPGAALNRAWGDRLGRLKAGYEADLVVVADNRPDPYRNLIEATEKDIQLVVIRGKAHYGTRTLMSAAGATGANAITVAGESRRILVKKQGEKDATMNWTDVKRDLERVRANPEKAWKNAVDAFAAWGGRLDDPEAPLAIIGDMPEGDLGAFGAAGELPPGLKIPPLDSLEHDADFFDAVDRTAAKLPGSATELKELRSYYS
jgi:cytosine/adenosine deaminase-related metal-dependent hydrolase